MLNRKYTDALQKLAAAKRRLADAEERLYPALFEVLKERDLPNVQPHFSSSSKVQSPVTHSTASTKGLP